MRAVLELLAIIWRLRRPLPRNQPSTGIELMSPISCILSMLRAGTSIRGRAQVGARCQWETTMAKRKERALARKGTASKRGKVGKKVKSTPRKSAKRTGAKVSAKKTAQRAAAKTRAKKPGIKPRARQAAL